MGIVARNTFTTRDGTMTFLSFSVPKAGARQAILDALSECECAVGLRSIVRQAFFLSRSADPREVRHAVSEAYGPSQPATTYVSQPPADGSALLAELWAFEGGGAVTQQEGVTLGAMGGATWGFVGGLQTAENEGPYDGVHRILRVARQDLERAGLKFAQVVRTWYYIGNILAAQGGESRYQLANRARNEFYRDYWLDPCRSPASTGIGMDTDRVALEMFALGPRGGPEVTWIDNPLQTPPYLYETQTDQDANPSFSRAAAVRLPCCTLLFVSGTASVRRSGVVHPGDLEGQTEATIENIATLIGEDNLAGKHGLAGGATLHDLRQLRVYVKRPEDLAIVRDRCSRCIPGVPASYLIADICIPDCLVEIEGVAGYLHY